MKTNLKSNSILLGGLLLLGTVFSCTQAEQDYASYVNPLSGQADMDIHIRVRLFRTG